MALWIRIDANIGDHPNVWKLAELRGVSAVACVGHLVMLFGNVAEYRPHGDVSDVPDHLLERWAGWGGEPGTFAASFRDLFVSDGVIDGWAERQGALIERAEKERERWHRRKLRGDSTEESAARNVTVRNTETLTAAPRVTRVVPSKAKGYPPEFEASWAIYPARSGDNPKRDAFQAWQARVNDGATPEVLHAGVERYRAFAESERMVGTKFVMQAKKFFGPSDRYLEPWTIATAGAPAPDERPRVLRATEMILS